MTDNFDDFDDMDAAEDERQARLADQRLDAWTAATPPVFAGEYPVHSAVARWIEGLLKGAGTNLVLVGGTGTTKTWHCYRAIRLALEAGWRGVPRLLTAAEWQKAITPPLDAGLLDRLATAGALVLDDVGATRLWDRDGERLLGIIDERWMYRRPTLVTTNVADLREMLGERIASRLAADAVVVTFDGPDLRRGAA
ncbi:ATP-binding protein [Herbidospora sp. NEAU-GS84]|uniref:ATP-binding protein n=1 Tax=Herbidospora solisilvae TaxID=2696284 RepID=A0A7C9J2I9_9ACTN|nr:ATP-binding protein [Herbidospora solisilvae]NAS22465.1 ATP-binding protein [Herbidospora solisilvae]